MAGTTTASKFIWLIRCGESKGTLIGFSRSVLADGTSRQFDAVIVAVPWRNVLSLFSEDLLAAMPALANIEQIEPAAITAVHLWFDGPITALPHAVLVGRLGQWVFSKPSALAGRHYCQVVISASHRLPERKHDELLADVCGELEAIWQLQNAGAAVESPPPRLLHGRVVAQPMAVFSVRPGLDRLRPPQQTPVANLALAGDWTATGWPATMEGAVRSGYLAAEAMGSAAADLHDDAVRFTHTTS